MCLTILIQKTLTYYRLGLMSPLSRRLAAPVLQAVHEPPQSLAMRKDHSELGRSQISQHRSVRIVRADADSVRRVLGPRGDRWAAPIPCQGPAQRARGDNRHG